MRHINIKLPTVILLMLSFLFLSATFKQEKMALKVMVKNIKSAKGAIYIAVYDNAEDYMENRFAEAIAPVEAEGELEAELKVPFGKYAVTIFHDKDDSGELNTNFLGIPKEPYGFSNNPKSSFGPPSFEQSLFTFSEDGQRIEIVLK